MRDLRWSEEWGLPVYDEPEDFPEGWPGFLAAHIGKPFAVAYWDIGKAKRLGVWAEALPTVAFLLFNWYPACSAIPMLFRWAYVPALTVQYRLWYSRRRMPCYLTLWARGEETDEYGYRYWTSRGLNRWSWFWFRLLLWPRATGKAYF